MCDALLYRITPNKMHLRKAQRSVNTPQETAVPLKYEIVPIYKAPPYLVQRASEYGAPSEYDEFETLKGRTPSKKSPS